MRLLRDAFGARTAVLHTFDLANEGRLLGLSYGGADRSVDELALNYMRERHPCDPRRARFLRDGPAAMGRWMQCVDDFDDEFAARDRFCGHFMAGYDVRYNSIVVMPVTDTVATTLAFELSRSRGPLNGDERQVAARLGTHLHDALRAYERIRRAVALAAQPVLDALPFPTWLIDADRFVSYANPSAQHETGTETRLALADGRLVLRGAAADRELGALFAGLAAQPHGARALLNARRRRSEPYAWLSLTRLDPPQSSA